jgi:predicted transport protein
LDAADGIAVILSTKHLPDSIYNPYMRTVEDYFLGYPESHRIFEAIRSVILALGEVEIRVSKSQVAFRTRKNIAVTWMPALYLKGKTAPLVLTLLFHSPDPSPRWKEIVQTSPNRFTHHLELASVQDVDEQVRNWLALAYIESRI